MTDSINIYNYSFKKEVIFSGRQIELEYLADEEEQSFTIVTGSVFLFLQQGRVSLKSKSSEHKLTAGMYSALSGHWNINVEKNSRLVLMMLPDYVCFNMTGGPVEETGRLKYIDGCSDSLLISPSRLGEPCLNLLHFPPGTTQSWHHHPSFRFGIVLSGSGQSCTSQTKQPLNPGDVFFIPELLVHKFETINSHLNVIAFHPDSDWGPTDEVHPMINKTFLTKDIS